MATPTSPKRKFSSISIVTLFVGRDRIPFNVHQNQLCELSTFFKAAFTSQFKEASEKAMNLPDDDVDTVDLFIQWLYTRECKIPSSQKIEERYFLSQPMRLLVFADKYDIPSLKETLLETLLAHVKERRQAPNRSDVKYAYANTCRGSGIRRLLADWYAWNRRNEYFEKPEVQDWLLEIPEFAVDLVNSSTKLISSENISPPVRTNKAAHYMDEAITGSTSN